MATKKILFPETMISPETGDTLKRDLRPFEVSYKGENIIVDLPGYYAAGNGEGVHVGKDMRIVDDALRELKLR
jgi:HTH-type transcriptional regulator / antitoxin MqsA